VSWNTQAGRHLAHGQVLVEVAAVPAVALHLHAQRKVLCERPGGRPPRLLIGVGPHLPGAVATEWSTKGAQASRTAGDLTTPQVYKARCRSAGDELRTMKFVPVHEMKSSASYPVCMYLQASTACCQSNAATSRVTCSILRTRACDMQRWENAHCQKCRLEWLKMSLVRLRLLLNCGDSTCAGATA
jgi:hypothetical protein